MSSNRRRSHIHFVKQYKSETLEYTGTRIVIFIKEKGIKYIKDFDNFCIHRYHRPKAKRHSISMWKMMPCEIDEVVKKVMINESICQKYKMIHILYESTVRTIEDFLEEALIEEDVILSKEEVEKIKEKIKK
ncbi:MAG: hypothetical protein GX209_07465 [Epulopiscium sp.]|nr:hypothetical protein [Candidatus Epulonipiscium sp.]